MVDLRKQNKNKTEKPMHKFLGVATYNKCAKLQKWSSWKFSFFKHQTLNFAKNISLSKIPQQYFSMQNQYNQTLTKFVLKSSTLIKKPSRMAKFSKFFLFANINFREWVILKNFAIINFSESMLVKDFARVNFRKSLIVNFKVGLSSTKKILFYLLHWKPFKNYEKCLLFHLKSSFR